MWRCKKCQEEHEIKKKAIRCCRWSASIDKYECKICFKEHNYRIDAEDCCPDEKKVEEVLEETKEAKANETK